MEKDVNFKLVTKYKLINLTVMASIDKFKELKSLIDGLEGDAEKFFSKGNSAAGTRVRKGLQDIKTLSQSLRLGIQDLKNKK